MIANRLKSGSLLSVLLLVALAISGQQASSAPQKAERQQENSAPTITDAKQKSVIRQLYTRYRRLGNLAMKNNDPNTSMKMYGEAVQEAELLNFETFDLLDSLVGLAAAYRALGKAEDSLKAEKKALEIRASRGGDDGKTRIAALVRMSDLDIDLGDINNASSCLQEALNLWKASAGDVPTAAAILERLLALSEDTGDREKAKAFLSELVALDRQRKADEDTAIHLEKYAGILWGAGQIKNSWECLSQALAIRSGSANPDDTAIISLTRNLARADLMLGKVSEAGREISKVLGYDRRHLAPDSPDYLFDLLSLAELKLRQGQLEPAQQLCQEVLSGMQAGKEESSLDLADALSLSARIAAAQSKWDEAAALAQKASSMKEQLRLSPTLSVNDYETLARANSAQGQIQEGQANLARALSIRQEALSSDQSALARLQADLKSLHEETEQAKSDNHIAGKLILNTE
jgi:ATP/maltotriose-dependent transcriptional regulator MalT